MDLRSAELRLPVSIGFPYCCSVRKQEPGPAPLGQPDRVHQVLSEGGISCHAAVVPCELRSSCCWLKPWSRGDCSPQHPPGQTLELVLAPLRIMRRTSSGSWMPPYGSGRGCSTSPPTVLAQTCFCSMTPLAERVRPTCRWLSSPPPMPQPRTCRSAVWTKPTSWKPMVSGCTPLARGGSRSWTASQARPRSSGSLSCRRGSRLRGCIWLAGD